MPRPQPRLRIINANVNGIRAALRRGGVDWLAAQDADVICLQEVRATHEQLHDALTASGLAHLNVAHSPASTLGRNGVTILTKQEPTAVRIGKKQDEFDHQGRWIEVDVDTVCGPLTAASVYVHTGDSVDVQRQAEKYRFLDAMTERMDALARRATRTGRQAVVCGDLNIAHTDSDLKNWKGNVGKAGCLPDERAYLDRWFARDRWIDVGRHLSGDVDGPYTWWTWRGQAFDNDVGWRIDYVLATRGLGERAARMEVGRAPTYAERWSDHAPVTVDVMSGWDVRP